MMFNTGDIARWNQDGELDMLGREDDQVKIKVGSLHQTLWHRLTYTGLSCRTRRNHYCDRGKSTHLMHVTKSLTGLVISTREARYSNARRKRTLRFLRITWLIGRSSPGHVRAEASALLLCTGQMVPRRLNTAHQQRKSRPKEVELNGSTPVQAQFCRS